MCSVSVQYIHVRISRARAYFLCSGVTIVALQERHMFQERDCSFILTICVKPFCSVMADDELYLWFIFY